MRECTEGVKETMWLCGGRGKGQQVLVGFREKRRLRLERWVRGFFFFSFLLRSKKLGEVKGSGMIRFERQFYLRGEDEWMDGC